MNNSLLLYQIALTLIPTIGPVQARILLEYIEPEKIFTTRKATLEKIEGIGEITADNIRAFNNFREAEREIAFIEKYRINPLFITDGAYPQRLLNCYDAPVLLYYRGNTNLNKPKIISIIGSRTHTGYGKLVTEKLIVDLASLDILIVSGLAYGIDALCHKAALKNKLATVAVLAHGLDQVYPPLHAGLARDMVVNGGLLTEYRSQTTPGKHNFPVRNRIVAGMSDATIVAETGIRGGSMITAELANGYNRDVYAFPGKVTDSKSAGCNYLIKNNKAVLLTDAGALIELMGWAEVNKKQETVIQPALFDELTVSEKKIMAILKDRDAVHIDELYRKSGLNSSAVAAAILNLELQNRILSHPGKCYSLA